MRKSIIVILLVLNALFALDSRALGQSISQVPSMQTTYVFSQDTIELNHLHFIILLEDAKGNNILFKYLKHHQVVLSEAHEKISLPIKVQYQVLDERLFEPYSLFRTDQIDSNIAFKAFSQNYIANTSLSLSQGADDLNIQGVYGRSFTVGNQQDLSMDAAFNLQVNGYFLDSVKIEAALTDQNLPFQPEGNTQQIQEFDQLYIKLSKKRHELIAGDFWLKSQPSHFIKTHKKVQGLYYRLQASDNTSSQWDHTVSTNFSVAKGSYTRNELITQDGNQGPYKLQGANGELFFIILSGSEKVYIDGQLQTRGEEYDYIIDYNSAEVTFMPQKPITKDSRVVIEFEYQDRNYLNTLWYGAYEANYKNKWQFGFQMYSNQDAKNQSYQQDLTSEQKLFLKQVADEDIDHVYFPSWREDTLNHQGVNYVMIDTMVDQQVYDSVWMYSPHSESQKYQVVFTHFGPNAGNYNLSMQAGNGKIFEWVAPLNGIPQGEYEPVMPLVAPKMHQLLSIYSKYALGKNHRISGEWTSSHYDANLFNASNFSAQTYHAANFTYEGASEWTKDTVLNITRFLDRKVSFQMVDRSFKALEPFREIEYQRNWNLNSLDSNYLKEWLLGIEVNYRGHRWKKVQLENHILSRDFKNINNRSSINALFEHKRWLVNLNTSLLIQKEEQLKEMNTFFKPRLEVIYFFQKEEAPKAIGIEYYSEQLNQRIPLNSFYNLPILFHEFKIYQQLDFGSLLSKLHYKWRVDQRNDSFGQTIKENESQEIAWDWSFLQMKNHQLNFLTTYRWVEYFQTLPEGAQSREENILGRIQYQGSFLKKIVQQQLNFDFGSGQEQKKSFIYIKVPPGQGQYMWVDYNEDGIEQANEFEIAIYEDQKEYIRVLTPTNDFVKVNYMQFNYQLNVRPDQGFKKDHPQRLPRFLSMISNKLQIQVNNRMRAEEGFKTYLPFYFPEDIEHLVNRVAYWSNHFSFQTPHKKWLADWHINRNNHQILMYYGLEQTEQNKQSFRIRWNMHSDWRLSFQYSPSYKSFHASEEVLKNYSSKVKVWEPELTYTMSSFMRWSLAYQYEDKFNITTEEEFRSQAHHLHLTGRVSKHEWGFINAKFEWVYLNAHNSLSGPLQYVILDALEDGHNFIWNLQWERAIGQGMNFSLFYEGRSVSNKSTIHSGRVTLRAML